MTSEHNFSRWIRSAVLLVSLSLCACSSNQHRTFAGFTFGGGGNTYSAEPAALTTSNGVSTLEAGKPGDATYLHLTWKTPDETSAVPLDLQSAQVVVQDKGGSTELESGHIVVQSAGSTISHGSFDLKTKHDDGREFTIVGSFTATSKE